MRAEPSRRISRWDLAEPAEFASADRAAHVVQSLLDKGRTVQAYDAATRALSLWKNDARLLRSLGLALARLRVFERANAVLLNVFRAGSRDAETAGILARTFKDLWEAEPRPVRRAALLRSAFRYYTLGFRVARRQADLDGAIYTGINAATTAWLMGRKASARVRAREVQHLCVARLKQGSDYWATASLAEADLLLGDLTEADRLYRRAAVLARRKVQWRASTRHNARLLLASMQLPLDMFDACFGIPRVLVVRDGGATVTEPSRNVIAYVQLLSVDDLRTAERLVKDGADVTMVLPLTPEALERCGHVVWASPRLRRRALRLFKRVARVVIANRRGSRLSKMTMRYVEALQRGLATLHAERLETDVVVSPAAPRTRALQRYERPALKMGGAFREEIKALLFADVAGYSGIDEAQIPRFVREFMGTVARRLAVSDAPPEIRYSWGDALYFVFPSAGSAARCALDLQRTIARKNWPRLGLPADLSLRISLHAGPALRCIDPIQRSLNYTGSHVSWAARIEPVTPPGQVYASEPFAALAASEKNSGVTCEYVGATMLAKGFGRYALYRVRARIAQAMQPSA